jgi:hypothetical protein
MQTSCLNLRTIDSTFSSENMLRMRSLMRCFVIFGLGGSVRGKIMGFFIETCSSGWQLPVGEGRFIDKIDDGVVARVSTGVDMILIVYCNWCVYVLNLGVIGWSQGRNDGKRFHHGGEPATS